MQLERGPDGLVFNAVKFHDTSVIIVRASNEKGIRLGRKADSPNVREKINCLASLKGGARVSVPAPDLDEMYKVRALGNGHVLAIGAKGDGSRGSHATGDYMQRLGEIPDIVDSRCFILVSGCNPSTIG